MIDKIVLIRLLQQAIDALQSDEFAYGMYREEGDEQISQDLDFWEGEMQITISVNRVEEHPEFYEGVKQNDVSSG